jgi:hypothetical protein
MSEEIKKSVPDGVEPKAPRKKKKWPWIIGIIIVLIIIIKACSGGSSGGSTSNAPTVSNAAVTSSTTAASSTANSAPVSNAATTKAYSAALDPGFYEIGVDIPAGTYDFAIVSGNGNVTTTSGNVNLVMGKQSDNMYQKTYKNAELNANDTLFVQQCSIKIDSKAADMNIKKRDNSTAKEVSFSAGNYTVGKDFKPGYYDISLVSGSGNVICQDNELNAIFGDDSSMGVKTYKNVPFKDGNKLQVEQVKVKLTPSK